MKSQLRMATLKGFVAGVVVVLGLSTVAVLAAPRTLNAIFGVEVVLDGRTITFDEDSQPFIVDNRTFLPLRAIADLLGIDVSFDGENNRAILATEEGCPE